MKANSLKLISAIVIALFVFGSTLRAQGIDSRIGQGHEVMKATAITKADADKKYPAPHGGSYPPGTRDAHDASGLVTSPYPPYQKYDCAGIAHGGLILDIRAKHVFVRP
jgi:hypothetical protein